MNKNELKIVFMGTPEIASKVFEAMILDGYKFVGLIAQPDRPVGRKGILEPVPTKKVAMKYNIPVFQPERIRKDYEFLTKLNPDVIVTMAYGQIVPQGVLDIPKYGCLNLHGSILPKYRGASPIQTSLINNDEVTGVTLMEMIDKMDAGKMFAVEEVRISLEDNSSSLFNKISDAARKLILEKLPLYIDGKLPGVEQNEEEATFCHMIKPEQEKLSFDLSVKDMFGWIRALSDEPGGYFLLDDQKFKVFKARIGESNVSHQVGEIVEADKFGLVVQCKDGLLFLDEVQLQGKKRMDYKSFINGNQNLKGKILK